MHFLAAAAWIALITQPVSARQPACRGGTETEREELLVLSEDARLLKQWWDRYSRLTALRFEVSALDSRRREAESERLERKARKWQRVTPPDPMDDSSDYFVDVVPDNPALRKKADDSQKELRQFEARLEAIHPALLDKIHSAKKEGGLIALAKQTLVEGADFVIKIQNDCVYGP